MVLKLIFYDNPMSKQKISQNTILKLYSYQLFKANFDERKNLCFDYNLLFTKHGLKETLQQI